VAKQAQCEKLALKGTAEQRLHSLPDLLPKPPAPEHTSKLGRKRNQRSECFLVLLCISQLVSAGYCG
jgi:hypothetical protein